jgi:hypothetical protein
VKHLAFVLVTGLLFLGTGNAFAQTKDIEVAARTFKFIEGAPAGAATLGIVKDASVAESASQADALSAALGGGSTVGGITLTPKVIGPDAIDGVDLVFVTNGLSGAHASIGEAARAKGIMTISTDMACVNAKQCVMGVASSPKVQIVVSRSASAAAGLNLNQALKMMVEERD